MIRIVSNYTRLLATLALGIALVPLTIAWLGDDAFGLITLLGSNIGLANLFRQIMQQSLVRELGAAYHGGDESIRRLYPAIFRISLVAAVLTFLAFLVFTAALPIFNMPAQLRAAAAWFLVAQGCQSAFMVFLSPILNMYLVTERFVGFTVWFVGVRATAVLAVVVLGFAMAINDPALGLALYGVVSAALAILGYAVAAWHIVRKDPRLRPTFRRPEPGAVGQVMGTFSWNSGVQVAMNLHEQLPQFLLNLFMGTTANAAWGLGFRLVAYIRMVTTGMQFGSDAVSARLAAGADPDLARARLQRLTEVQTRLTGLVSLPAGMGVLIYCFPILHLWVGGRLEDYDATMGMAVVMARVLAVALAARAVSDTWVLVLYGAGYIRAYAPLVIAGGVVAPVIAGVLMALLPGDVGYIGPAVGFSAVFVCMHFFGLPVIAARCLHLSAFGLLLSVGRPLLVTLVAAAAGMGVLAVGGRIGDLSLAAMPTRQAGQAIDPAWMLASIGVFGPVYAPLAFLFVLGPAERSRVTGIVLRRLGRRPAAPPAAEDPR